MRKTLSTGSLAETITGSRVLVLSVHENEYGVFYNVMLSNGESLMIDASFLSLQRGD